MGLRIATNIPSLATQRNVENTSRELNKSFVRLSSGKRVSNAADDAAGLSIGTNLDAQVRSMQQAGRNANNAVSLVQTAEGSLNEVSNILIRLRELGVQAASDTVGDHERLMIDREYVALKDEINRIAKSTQFNGTELLSGEGREMSFQVGAFGDPSNVIRWNSGETNATIGALDIDSISAVDKESAESSLNSIDFAIHKVNDYRASLGAIQNRLHSSSNSLGAMITNLSEARSRVVDTDIAEESANLMKNTILQNAGIAVLAQANAAPQAATRLL